MFIFRIDMRTVVIALIALAASAAYADDLTEVENLIREIRATSNEAILNRDTDTLRTTWWPDLYVASSGGAQITSGNQMANAFAGRFQDPEFRYFRRTAEIVTVSPQGDLAFEIGHWVGVSNRSGTQVEIGGPYSAQWQLKDSEWRIQAELYALANCAAPLSCNISTLLDSEQTED